MRTAAYEPLNLAVISTGVKSRTSKPIDKDLTPKPENPTSKALAKQAAREPDESDSERNARIEAERQRQLKEVKAAVERLAKG
jgi:hypothetical protein